MAPCFPLFISLEEQQVIIIGGGKIAARRIAALLPFDCRITVIAPEICPELEALSDLNSITFIRRPYQPGDCIGARIAVAATSSRAVNHAAGEECHRLEIPVSVADCREECSFFFPAIARHDMIVAGLTASGNDHGLVKRLATKLRKWLPQAAESEIALHDKTK